MHLQDVGIIIYVPRDSAVIVVVWVKVTLRERIVQAGYCKLKLLSSAVTKDVKIYFITHDEDGTLQTTKPAKKGSAMVEVDIDAIYRVEVRRKQQGKDI